MQGGGAQVRGEELELWVAGEVWAGSGAAPLQLLRVWVAPEWLLLPRAAGRGWEQLVPRAGGALVLAEVGTAVRSPALQLSLRKIRPCCSPGGRAGSALQELLPLPYPPSACSKLIPGLEQQLPQEPPQPHRKGSVVIPLWGRAQAAC